MIGEVVIPENTFPRVCSCKRTLGRDDADFLDKTEEKGIGINIYWFNCLHCQTTFIKKENRDDRNIKN